MNKFNFKSLVAVLLTVLMVFSVLPVTVSAAETTTDKKYTFADYAKGEQYAMEEVHVLDNVITVTTSDAHFREELRMYDSEGATGHNSIAVITSTNVIRSVVLNVGNNVATLNVYGSTDGTTWTLVEGVAVVKNYADYTVNMPDGVDYTSLKLDVEGLKQLRVKYMTLTLVGASTPDTPDVPETPVVPATLAEQIAAAKALANKEYLPYDSTITGTITDAPQVSSYTEGQYKFTVSDGTNTLLCYFVPVTGGTPETGDTVTVTGKLTAYNGSAQFDSTAAATITKKGEAETPENPETPTDTVVTAPKAGVAYKFGMVQGNLNNKIYYLKGGMNGYYLDTTDDVASAIDVFLEETDGGYYLYTMVDGVKTYINMVVSGTHVNGAYETTATTVYTWNAEKNTITAVVNGEDYWHGTRNDKTYTTAGPVKVSYNGFYCQFYPVATDAPIEPPKPQDPAADSTLTIVEALALGASKAHNTYTAGKYYVVGEITEVYNTQYGNMKIKDAEGNILTIYGTYSADGSTRYDKMEVQPVAGDTVKIYGIVGQFNGTAQIKNGWIVEHTPAVCEHANTEIVGAKEATETEEGYTGDKVCTKCGETVEQGTTIPVKAPETVEPAPTGDAIIVVVVAVLLAGAAIALISRKRRFN